MKARGEFRLTRGQAGSLARALRQADWVSDLPGDFTATLVHPSGIEVTIDVRVPAQAPRAIVVRGFRPEGP